MENLAALKYHMLIMSSLAADVSAGTEKRVGAGGANWGL
jgi:hypothetical protein